MKKITAGLISFLIVLSILSYGSLLPNATVSAQSPETVSINKETWSPFATSASEPMSVIVQGKRDYIAWWAVSNQYSETTPVWGMVKLSDAPIGVDGFRLFMDSMGIDYSYFNFNAWKIYATNDDSAWKNANLDWATISTGNQFKLLFDSEKDVAVPVFGTGEGEGYANVPCWPIPDGINTNDYTTIGQASSESSFTNYQKFTSGTTDAKYIIFAITGAPTETVCMSALEIVGAPATQESVTGITINYETANLFVGNELALIPNVLPANAMNKSITWSSSDTSKAEVASNGKVTAKAVGSAVI